MCIFMMMMVMAMMRMMVIMKALMMPTYNADDDDADADDGGGHGEDDGGGHVVVMMVMVMMMTIYRPRSCRTRPSATLCLSALERLHAPAIMSCRGPIGSPPIGSCLKHISGRTWREDLCTS